MARRTPAQRKGRSTKGRVATALGLAGVTAVSARYANAAFTGSTSVIQNDPTGLVAGGLDLDTSDPDSQAFGLAVTNFSPNVTRQRVVNVTVGGTVNLKTLTVLISDVCTDGCLTSLLTNNTSGLKLAIERCSSAWTASGTSPDRTYTCSDAAGGTYGGTAIVASTAIATLKFSEVNPNPVNLTTGSLLTVGSVNRYLFSYQLPAAAPNTMQGLTSSVLHQFSGTQRDGIVK